MYLCLSIRIINRHNNKMNGVNCIIIFIKVYFYEPNLISAMSTMCSPIFFTEEKYFFAPDDA